MFVIHIMQFFTIWKSVDCLILTVMRMFFALQFVFIPRINSQLHQFVDTWNRDSIRTENGLTPLQLWSRGILSATPQIQEEIAEGLLIDADYGVETGEQSHTNIFDSESVVVPEIDVGLCDQQLEYIYDHYNPLQRGDCNGIDVYIAVREHIASVI